MNIHPLVVHFPIAFLTLYAVLECVRFRKVMDWAPFVYIKATLLFAGVLGGVVAVMSGEQAEKLYGETQLVEIHSSFAVASVWVFAVIALVYVVLLLEQYREKIPTGMMRNIFEIKVKVAKWIYKNLLVILAIIGFVMVMITGALGGALVYGPEVDPFVSFVYKIFIR